MLVFPRDGSNLTDFYLEHTVVDYTVVVVVVVVAVVVAAVVAAVELVAVLVAFFVFLEVLLCSLLLITQQLALQFLPVVVLHQ